MAAPSMFAALAGSRPYAWTWSGQTPSRLGDAFYRVALAWWTVQTTGSAAALGLVLLCTALPQVVLALWGGALADRRSRAAAMLGADLLRGSAVGGITLLAVTGNLTLPWICALSAVCGLAQSVFDPAYNALVQEIVPESLRTSANSLNSTSTSVVSISGLLLGAVFVQAFGTVAAFGINALSFFISAACLVPVLPHSRPPAPGGARVSTFQSIREGIAWIRERPWLWLTIAAAAVANAFYVASVLVALPLLVTRQLGGNADALGILLAGLFIGTFTGATLAGRAGGWRRRGPVIYATWALQGGCLGLVAFQTHLWLAVPLMIGTGLSISLHNLAWLHRLQEVVPRPLMGRISSLDTLGLIFTPVAYFGGGIVADRQGPALPFFAVGLVLITIGLAGLLAPATRQID